MKSIILCEGKTDLVLYSYYLIKVCGWKSLDEKENRTDKKRFLSRLSSFSVDYDNQKFCWYFKNDDLLCIYAVGSNDLFAEGLQQIIEINMLTSAENFEKVVILSDRDDEESEPGIIKAASSVFNKNNIQFTDITHNSWNTSDEYDDMGEKKKITLLPLVIPFDETGTIETFLLNCRKEINDNEKSLVESIDKFINELDKNEYVHKNYMLQRGLKPKVKFGAYFALISPNKTFDEGNKVLISIPWEQYTGFHKVLGLLIEI